jgi:hypothetical protein
VYWSFPKLIDVTGKDDNQITEFQRIMLLRNRYLHDNNTCKIDLAVQPHVYSNQAKDHLIQHPGDCYNTVGAAANAR